MRAVILGGVALRMVFGVPAAHRSITDVGDYAANPAANGGLITGNYSAP